MSATTALEQQHALFDYLASGPYAAYATGVLRGEKAAGNPAIVNERGEPDGAAWARLERARLQTAETFYVAPDMVTLVEAAARSLDGTDRFEDHLWPAQSGFCWFARPLYVTEARGRTTTIRAISWSGRSANGHHGMLLSEYSDLDDPNDEVTASIRAEGAWEASRRTVGRLQLAGLTWLPDGRRVGPTQNEITDEEAARYQAAHSAAYGEDPATQPPVVTTQTNVTRLYLSLILMMGQTVTRVERQDPDRQVARRAKRAGLPTRVTVITLRRAAEDSTDYIGPVQVERTHRWLVRGTYQWRHCGPEHPLAQPYEKGYRCRVFVHGHIKGPPSAPLIVKDHVYALTR